MARLVGLCIFDVSALIANISAAAQYGDSSPMKVTGSDG